MKATAPAISTGLICFFFQGGDATSATELTACSECDCDCDGRPWYDTRGAGSRRPLAGKTRRHHLDICLLCPIWITFGIPFQISHLRACDTSRAWHPTPQTLMPTSYPKRPRAAPRMARKSKFRSGTPSRIHGQKPQARKRGNGRSRGSGKVKRF